MSEVRLNSTNARAKRQVGGQQRAEIAVPATDFDFQGSNARFDKSALAAHEDDSDTNTNPSEDGEDSSKAASKATKEKDGSYDPKRSFFDTLSSSAGGAPMSGRGGRGGGRRGGGKSRREEEREKNVATFGEPGGVGLMGPGAYVGGYGHGRRGGGRGGRRGGGRRTVIPAGAGQ